MSSQNKKRKHEEVDEQKDTKLKESKANDEDIDESEEQSEDSEEDSSDVDDSDDSEDNEFLNQEISIDFSAYQPIDEDFNGIKCLLSQLWLKEKINLSELTQLLIDQKQICSVLKQESDEDEEDKDTEDKDKDKSDEEEDLDVYGITSVIPLTDYSEKDCVKQIREVLATHSPKDSPIHKLLTNSSEKIGLIVNERFTNLPPKISLPSLEQLVKDIKSAKSDKQNKLNVEFKWFLIVCKILKTKQTNDKKSDENQLIYMNAEEELFDELSQHSFEYSVADQCDSDVFDWKDSNKLMEPFRKVLVLTNENWNKAINSLNKEFKSV